MFTHKLKCTVTNILFRFTGKLFGYLNSSKAWEKDYVIVFRDETGHKMVFMAWSQCVKRMDTEKKSWKEI